MSSTSRSLLFQIACHPEIMRLTAIDDDLDDLEPEELIIQWINFVLSRAGSPIRVEDWESEPFKDSSVGAALLAFQNPKLSADSITSVQDSEERAEILIEKAKTIGSTVSVSPEDIAEGSFDSLIELYCNLFLARPCLSGFDSLEEVSPDEAGPTPNSPVSKTSVVSSDSDTDSDDDLDASALMKQASAMQVKPISSYNSKSPSNKRKPSFISSRSSVPSSINKSSSPASAAEIAMLKAKIADMKTQVETAEKAKADAIKSRAEVEQKATKLNELETSLEGAEAARDAVSEALHNAQIELAQSNANLDQKNAENDSLTNRLAVVQGKLAQIHAEKQLSESQQQAAITAIQDHIGAGSAGDSSAILNLLENLSGTGVGPSSSSGKSVIGVSQMNTISKVSPIVYSKFAGSVNTLFSDIEKLLLYVRTLSFQLSQNTTGEIKAQIGSAGKTPLESFSSADPFSSIFANAILSVSYSLFPDDIDANPIKHEILSRIANVGRMDIPQNRKEAIDISVKTITRLIPHDVPAKKLRGSLNGVDDQFGIASSEKTFLAQLLQRAIVLANMIPKAQALGDDVKNDLIQFLNHICPGRVNLPSLVQVAVKFFKSKLTSNITLQAAVPSMLLGEDIKISNRAFSIGFRDMAKNFLRNSPKNPVWDNAISRELSPELLEISKGFGIYDILGGVEEIRILDALLDAKVVRERAEEVAQTVIRLFLSNHHALKLVKFSISREIMNCTAKATLFRANNVTTKMMGTFAKMVGGKYLRNTMKSKLQSVLDLDPAAKPFEIDEFKLKPGEDVLQNVTNLTELCQDFLDTIFMSIGETPDPIRLICGHLKNEVSKKFPESTYSSVGGFIFLRFFCPSIVSPKVFGVLPIMPTGPMRRALVLISKVLQNLSNGILFGDKEEAMIPMNPFIQNNLDELKGFFDTVSNVSFMASSSLQNAGSGTIGETGYDLPDSVFSLETTAVSAEAFQTGIDAMILAHTGEGSPQAAQFARDLSSFYRGSNAIHVDAVRLLSSLDPLNETLAKKSEDKAKKLYKLKMAKLREAEEVRMQAEEQALSIHPNQEQPETAQPAEFKLAKTDPRYLMNLPLHTRADVMFQQKDWDFNSQPDLAHWFFRQTNMGRWKRSYFVLQGDIVTFYKGENAEKPSGVLFVMEIKARRIPPEEANRDNCFQLIYSGKKPLIISAPSVLLVDRWIKALKKARKDAKLAAATQAVKTIGARSTIRKRNIKSISATMAPSRGASTSTSFTVD